MSVQGCKRAKHKTDSPLDDQLVILSSSKAFDYFRTRRGEIRCVFDRPYVYKLDYRKRPAERFLFKVCRRTSEDLSVFVVFLIKVCRLRRKTFLFLFCFLFLLFFLSFLFFSTANFLQRFLRHFSTDLYQIWHVDSPWWDEEPEYFSSQ